MRETVVDLTEKMGKEKLLSIGHIYTFICWPGLEDGSSFSKNWSLP